MKERVRSGRPRAAQPREAGRADPRGAQFGRGPRALHRRRSGHGLHRDRPDDASGLAHGAAGAAGHAPSSPPRRCAWSRGTATGDAARAAARSGPRRAHAGVRAVTGAGPARTAPAGRRGARAFDASSGAGPELGQLRRCRPARPRAKAIGRAARRGPASATRASSASSSTGPWNERAGRRRSPPRRLPEDRRAAARRSTVSRATARSDPGCRRAGHPEARWRDKLSPVSTARSGARAARPPLAGLRSRDRRTPAWPGPRSSAAAPEHAGGRARNILFAREPAALPSCSSSRISTGSTNRLRRCSTISWTAFHGNRTPAPRLRSGRNTGTLGRTVELHPAPGRSAPEPRHVLPSCSRHSSARVSACARSSRSSSIGPTAIRCFSKRACGPSSRPMR